MNRVVSSGVPAMSEQTLSQRIAEFSCGLSPSAIPDDVTELVRLHILDSIGVAFSGSQTAFCDSVAKGARALSEGAGRNTVLGFGFTLPMADSALVNGVAMHSEDFDDTVFSAAIHPSCVVASTALAVGETVGATAENTISAMTVGYEVMIRLGLMGPGEFLERGFHSASVCGVFGAAAVAAKLLALNAEQTRNALGIAGSMSSGILEYLGDGSSMKQFHPGWAAKSGITAATMASAGCDGPRYVFEGRHGLFRSFLGRDAYDRGDAFASLGAKWATRDIAFKMYPMCHFLHSFADGLLELRARHGLRADQVEEISCFISPKQVDIVCEPIAHKRRPRTPYEAKFSLSFVMAAAFIDGSLTLDTFSDSNIGREDIFTLAERVNYEPSDRSRYPASFSGDVVVKLVDGRQLEISKDAPRGSPESGVGLDDLLLKFQENLRSSNLPLDIAAIEDAYHHFRGEGGVRSLLAACALGSER